MPKKLLMIFGTRPEAIKFAPLIEVIRRHKDRFELKICVTAQHREMLDQMLSLFNIVPDYDLHVMEPNQDFNEVTSKILERLKGVFEDFSPDLVLVQGDTATTYAASLAAFYDKRLIAHIEAGMRTRHLLSPFPEELYRRQVGALAHYHFVPSEIEESHLMEEGVHTDSIFVTGNTVVDSLYYVSGELERNALLSSKIKTDLIQRGVPLDRKLVLVTCHRRENFGDRLSQICEALLRLADDYPDLAILFPVHLNPKVRDQIFARCGNRSNIFLMDPLDYVSFVFVMSQAYMVLTDSGGIQEEAPCFGVPVLVLRDRTERLSAVDCGGVWVVGSNQASIVNSAKELLEDEEVYQRRSQPQFPYGKGDSSSKIFDALCNIFSC